MAKRKTKPKAEKPEMVKKPEVKKEVKVAPVKEELSPKVIRAQMQHLAIRRAKEKIERRQREWDSLHAPQVFSRSRDVRWKELLEGYKEFNPEKYKLMKENGQLGMPNDFV